MVHLLKIKPEYFKDVQSRIKTFEVRKNDRNFKVGDFVILREWQKWHDDVRGCDQEGYTGKMLVGRIDYVLTDPEFVKEGYAVFSFVLVDPWMVCGHLPLEMGDIDRIAVYEYIIHALITELLSTERE